MNEVRAFAGGKTITESLKIALTEWVSVQKIRALNQVIQQKPLRFDFDPAEIRNMNREIR